MPLMLHISINCEWNQGHLKLFVYSGDTPMNCEITNILPPDSHLQQRDSFRYLADTHDNTHRSRPGEKQSPERPHAGRSLAIPLLINSAIP